MSDININQHSDDESYLTRVRHSISSVFHRTPVPRSVDASRNNIAESESRLSTSLLSHSSHAGDEIAMKTAKTRKDSVLISWWSEILAMILSMAALIAIVAVLLSFHNKRLDSWNAPWHVRPNTIVSVLMIICRLAMMLVVAECLSQLKWIYFEQRAHPLKHFQTFDDASRGPWGSLHLLWSIRWTALVASGGALVTILALAMEPFAQQVLSYPVVNETDFNSATISNASSYDFNTGYVWILGTHTGDPYGQAGTPVMTGAMLGALSNASFDVPFGCESGNCTWPKHYSLGVCSSCRNVTSELTKGNCTESQPALSQVSVQFSQKVGYCEYTTPLNTTLGISYLQSQLSTAAGSGSTYTLWNSSSPKDTDSPVTIPEITYVSALRLPDNWIDNACGYGTDGCTIPDPQAYDCTLSWCVKEYASSRVVNGTLIDVPSAEVPLRFPFAPDTVQSADQPPDPDSCLYDGELGDGDHFTPLLIGGYTGTNKALNGKCDQYLRDKHNSSATAWINVQDTENLKYAVQATFSQALSGGVTESNIGQVLWNINDGNFSKTMETVAMAMTNTIRQTANATEVRGEVISAVTVIRVNWPWLIYPAALVAFTALFMLATIIFSSERSRVVWKSSTLAILFHGLRGLNHHTLNARTLADMDGITESMHVRLQEDEEGLNLRKQD